MKNHMDFPVAQVDLGLAFKNDSFNGSVLDGMQKGNPYAPKVDESYIFNPKVLRDLVLFWGLGLKGLKLIGDPSTGKTSSVVQWHAGLGLPLFIQPCHESMTDTELLGQMLPQTDGSLKWFDAPALQVYRHGGSILFDEWNNLSPNAATIMNAMLEGYAISIPQTGEVVEAHPNVRFFATQNPVDGKCSVQGRYVQDAASDDRWMEMHVDYPTAAEEEAIIYADLSKRNGSDVAQVQMVAKKLVSIASSVRSKYRSDKPEDAVFAKPISTRVLKRWANLLIGYHKMGLATVDGEAVLIASLHRAFGGISQEMKSALFDLIKESLGSK